jgi:hypothetical protein
MRLLSEEFNIHFTARNTGEWRDAVEKFLNEKCEEKS